MFHMVTGASGFVGRHLIRYLISLGERVHALVRSHEDAVTLQKMGVSTVVGDICERSTLSRAIHGARVIYHCAAASPSCDDDEIRRTNLDGVRNLLHVAQHEGSSRIILLSSTNVLGPGSYENATELSPTRRSREVFADVKIDSEQLGLQFSKTRGTDVTILRPGLIYGPGEHYIPKLANSIRQGKFFFIGSRNNVIPLIFVRDMVRLMVIAARTDVASGRIYHATDGSRTTIGQLVNTVADLMGSARPLRVLPYCIPRLACSVFEVAGRRGAISRTALRFLGTSRHVNIDLARRELGFEPKVSLLQGIQQTLLASDQPDLVEFTNRRAA